jgi:uncharacterized BrkB/YihY/UPF0761 family membrane protein
MIKADFPGMAAEMAFMFILGFFPFILFLMQFVLPLQKYSIVWNI